MTIIQETKQQHLQSLIDRFTQRTAQSKKLAQAHRSVLADKSSIGFNFTPETKEMCYPIAVDRSQGAKLWDIDENEYVDILMGLGTHLCGHNPPFLHEAILQQLDRGVVIGPQSPIVGEVAQLISNLTGMERVTFSNTGTEAIMTAIRMARAQTGRGKIAIFTNSYHGHLDATLMRAPLSEYAKKAANRVLARQAEARPWLSPLSRLVKAVLQSNQNPKAVPAALGIPRAIAQDTLVLDYGNPRSLQVIQDHHKQLAAVLVEPVQSRCPENQPAEFLKELRELTQRADIALIFDEMVTGFRVHPGGAQAYFGIQADLATYSKIVGGGLPLSVIAGKSQFMNRIDGGFWQFGDDSAPMVKTTFFAGTFCKHPLALATAKAMLEHLQGQGEELQNQLNQKTANLVQRLNDWMMSNQIPLEFTRFGSFFAIALSKSRVDSQALNLLSYHLLNRGVHLRGGDKGGFLSTAHGQDEIEKIFSAFTQSASELKEAGFFNSNQ